MAALRKGLGRKRRLDVWTHFRYLDAERKTLCLIVSEEGKQCGHKIEEYYKLEETSEISTKKSRYVNKRQRLVWWTVVVVNSKPTCCCVPSG